MKDMYPLLNKQFCFQVNVQKEHHVPNEAHVRISAVLFETAKTENLRHGDQGIHKSGVITQ